MDTTRPVNPDLASILSTLAAYTPVQAHSQIQRQAQGQADDWDLEEGEYDPDEYDPSQHHLSQTVKQVVDPTATNNLTKTDSRSSTSQHAKASSLNTASGQTASSIKTWPKAVTYTVRYICSDEEKMRRIHHLMEDQHKHEQQWWSRRQELSRIAKNRDASRTRLNGLLTIVGAAVKDTKHGDSDAELARELSNFDTKVHRACQEMVEAGRKVLRDLDVPFFCKGYGDTAEEKKQMPELQSKMIGFLEAYITGDKES